MTTPKAKTTRKPRVAKVVAEQFTTKTPAATEISLNTTPMPKPLMLTTPDVPSTISFVDVVSNAVEDVTSIVPQNEWHEIMFLIPDPKRVSATSKAWLAALSEVQRLILGFGKMDKDTTSNDHRWSLIVDNAALERLRAIEYDKLPEQLK